jgi:uncharacterized membrane protein YbaN (DUF454 family)
MRIVLLVAGWICMALGLAGVFLPLLPATPFLLLAAACFLRASPRMHARLMAHPRLGPLLERWQRERSVPLAAKRRAYVLVIVSFTISILLVDGLLVRSLLAGLGLGLLVFLRCLRTSA